MCIPDSNEGLQEPPLPHHPFEARQEHRQNRGEVYQGKFSSRPSHRHSLTDISLTGEVPDCNGPRRGPQVEGWPRPHHN